MRFMQEYLLVICEFIATYLHHMHRDRRKETSPEKQLSIDMKGKRINIKRDTDKPYDSQ